MLDIYMDRGPAKGVRGSRVRAHATDKHAY